MARDFSRRRLLQLGGTVAASVVLSGPRAFAAPGQGAANAAAGKPPAPTGMLTDLLPKALGTSAGQNPRFSWQVPDFCAGTVQRAYQLQLAATPGGFEDDELVWDSGRRTSADSTAVPYGGPALKPRTAYWWRVGSWGEKRSAWSEPTLLATSVEDEWEAEPIWAPAGPVMTDGTLTVRVKITAVAAGLWFRAANTADNYMWQLRAGATGVLRKHVCVGGTYTVLGEVKLPFAVTAGEWVDLSVTMTGSTFTTTVDGTVVDTTTDSRYASGNVGLRNGSTESQTYDRVTFTAADGTVLLDDDFASDKGTFATGTVSGGVLTFPTGASSLSSYGADDTWALLRHEYDTKAGKEIAAAVLYVAATSPDPARQYVAKVWSNGTTVGYASVRSGTGTAYQAFDVTSTLRADGKANALAALCWTTSQQKFLAQLEITYTDGSRLHRRLRGPLEGAPPGRAAAVEGQCGQQLLHRSAGVLGPAPRARGLDEARLRRRRLAEAGGPYRDRRSRARADRGDTAARRHPRLRHPRSPTAVGWSISAGRSSADWPWRSRAARATRSRCGSARS